MRKVLIKPAKQKGAALVTAIFAILIATAIGVTLYHSAMISFTVAINERDNAEALYLADAGVNHAAALIGKVPRSQASLILIAGTDPTPNSGDELSISPVTGLWTTSQGIPAGNTTGGGVTSFGAGGKGRYWVSVRNDMATGETATTDLNGTLIITSTGIGRDGATATIESAVRINEFPAVLINGKAKIAGNPSIKGSMGVLHSNDTLLLDGNPCADKYFSSTVNIINKSNLKGAGCLGIGNNLEYQSVIPPPLFNIRNDFYSKATYILGAGEKAGKVYDSTGAMIHNTAATGGKWSSGSSTWTWSASSSTWTHSGNTILTGTFYSEGNMDVGGSFGSSTIPARVTFIAEGFVSFAGKMYITPALTNYSIMAGTDLRISGKIGESDDMSLEGIHYAHHQINFSGTPNINGVVIAANQADTNSPGCGCNPVPLGTDGYITISGNPVITYNGNLFAAGITSLSWRELRY